MDQQPAPRNHVAVDVGEVVTDAVRRLTPLLKSRNVRVDIEADIDPVDGNFNELHHLVTNLLTNALRHSPSDLAITISVRQSGDDIVFDLQDSGPGFGTEDPQQLLRPFIAGPNSRSTGLGLSICSEVVKRHHGKISLSTNQTGGLVQVRLPRRTRRKSTT